MRYKEGAIHGLLASRTMEGKLIAEGDLVQVTRGAHLTIDATTVRVTSRFKEKGEKKVVTSQLGMQPDLANGINLEVLKNISPATSKTTVST